MEKVVKTIKELEKLTADDVAIIESGDNWVLKKKYDCEIWVRKNAVIKYAYGNSVIILPPESTAKVPKNHPNVHRIISVELTKKMWLGKKDLEKEKGFVYLYHSVKDDYTDFYTGKIKFLIGTTVIAPDWDNDKKKECGGGFHLCATPEQTQSFHQGKIMRCKVKTRDIVVHPFP